MMHYVWALSKLDVSSIRVSHDPGLSILHFMAAQERRFNIVVKHTEDEISAINMAIGAGFAGVRAMCGTSGGDSVS